MTQDTNAARPHDEAFKKLLQTFFAEFIALFFPKLDLMLDHSRTRQCKRYFEHKVRRIRSYGR